MGARLREGPPTCVLHFSTRWSAGFRFCGVFLFLGGVMSSGALVLAGNVMWAGGGWVEQSSSSREQEDVNKRVSMGGVPR